MATRLLAAGGLRWNPVEAALTGVPGATARPDDERFTAITARRPTIEWAFAATLAETAGVEVRRGVALDGFVPGTAVAPGVPHVTGVRTIDGEEICGDLVVDATGRRSATGDWLRALGTQPVPETVGGLRVHVHRSLLPLGRRLGARGALGRAARRAGPSPC